MLDEIIYIFKKGNEVKVFNHTDASNFCDNPKNKKWKLLHSINATLFLTDLLNSPMEIQIEKLKNLLK